MDALTGSTLAYLAALVACDSTNPPRRSEAILTRLSGLLRAGGLGVDVRDHGEGCVSVLATRGRAGVVMNAHVDTVPIAPGWTRDPFTLVTEGDRAFGLGACDVKGGAAAMMAAALSTDAPCALLFTTDEEAGSATCMRAFVAERAAGYALAIVAEPTRARAVVAHRGVATGRISFSGQAGHGSQRGAVSAVHALLRWGTEALAAAERDEALADARLNVGRVEGGEKPNVVAARAEARFGVRPPPSRDPREVLRRFAALAPEGHAFEPAFYGPPLPHTKELGERAAAEAMWLRLPTGPAVDFWTEASLLSAAGVPSIVLGPGDIAQAHGPDEWVALEELSAAARLYREILLAGASAAPSSSSSELGAT